MGGAMLCLLLLAACQKKKIFTKDKDVPLDARVEQIKQNYENDAHAQQLGLKPDWSKADFHSDKNGWVLIPIDGKTELIVLKQDQVSFVYRKMLYTGRGSENIRLMYDAQGMLQAALHDKNERINVYRLRAEERNYGFHHINSREAKYESWENFDFLDFDFAK